MTRAFAAIVEARDAAVTFVQAAARAGRDGARLRSWIARRAR